MTDGECAICYETLGEIEDDTRQLLCNHWFHSNCIGKWLERKGTCPTCRQRVPDPDGNVDDTEDAEDTEEEWMGNEAIMNHLQDVIQRLHLFPGERALRALLDLDPVPEYPVVEQQSQSQSQQEPEVSNIVALDDTRWIVCTVNGAETRFLTADVDLVRTQTDAAMPRCLGAMYMFEGDVVNAILHLTAGL